MNASGSRISPWRHGAAAAGIGIIALARRVARRNNPLAIFERVLAGAYGGSKGHALCDFQYCAEVNGGKK